MLAMFWPFKVTDLRWTVFWLVLLLAFAVGQEFAPVTTTDDATEGVGLPHGESGLFLVEQQTCFDFMRRMGVVPGGAMWHIQCKWQVQARFARRQDGGP